MSEKETLGMTEQVSETREVNAAKKKKRNYTIAKIVVALCLVLLVVLSVFEMGFTYRTMKAVEVEGTEYSVAEYNWLYTNSVYDIYNEYYMAYGQLASYFFNPQMPLDEQQYTEDQTLADYGGIVYNTWTKDDEGNYIYEYLGYVDDEIIAEVDELIANALPTYEISIYGNFTALEAGETFYIFNEEIERFFHGEITAEECAAVLQDRISIYLSENYD